MREGGRGEGRVAFGLGLATEARLNGVTCLVFDPIAMPRESGGIRAGESLLETTEMSMSNLYFSLFLSYRWMRRICQHGSKPQVKDHKDIHRNTKECRLQYPSYILSTFISSGSPAFLHGADPARPRFSTSVQSPSRGSSFTTSKLAFLVKVNLPSFTGPNGLTKSKVGKEGTGEWDGAHSSPDGRMR
jgi:hypothetical protein